MTVKELIEALKQFPEELEVMYEDNEHGESEINQVEIDEIKEYTSHFPDIQYKIIKYISLK